MKLLQRLSSFFKQGQRDQIPGEMPCDDGPFWEQKIALHLDRLPVDKALLDPLLDSYEAARSHLTIRLHTQKMYEGFPHGTEGYILQPVLPELYAALALDLPEQFHVLQKTEIEKWDIDEDELFWTAYANLGDKKAGLKIVEREVEGYTLVTLFDRDYSAAYAVDFANHCSQWIGPLGALVAFPNRGSVFMHPIHDPRAFNGAFGKIAELTNKFYQEDPGPLINNIYWYHNQRFELFPKHIEGHSLTYSIPNRLLAYLKTPLAKPLSIAGLKDVKLSGDWEGYFVYGKGHSDSLRGKRRGFQLTLRSKGGQLDGACLDEQQNESAGIWGFMDKELISFIKKDPANPSVDIHYTGFYEATDASFSGTWAVDKGNGDVCSGSWTMVKL